MRVSWGDRLPLAAVIAATAMTIAPVWMAPAGPAMPDYPAHLASFYLIAGQPSEYYRIVWAAIPNLASEALVPILGRVIGIPLALQIFISAALAMWVMGPALIQRALFGRFGVSALASAFFAYNVNFLWGFFNYVFAAGLSFLVFAGWIASARWPKPVRIAVFVPALLAVYFSHLFAAAALLMLIGMYEMMLWLDERPLRLASAFDRVWPIAVIALPALLAFVFLKPSGGADAHVAFNLLSSWQDRLEAFVDAHFDEPDYLLLTTLAVLLLIGLWRRWIVLHRHMWLALAALFLAAVFMPEEAMGGWGVDLRLPPVFGALVFAAGELRVSRHTQVEIAGVALLVIGLTASSLAGNWQYVGAQFDEFRAADSVLPRNAKVVTVLDGDAIGKASDQPYWHLGEFAIIDRNAFTQLMFATPGQHVVQVVPALRPFVAQTAMQGSPPDISELDDLAAGQIDDDTDIATVFPYLMRFQCHFDDALVIHLNGKRSRVPGMLHLIHAGSFFSLYRIDASSCPRP